MKDTMRILNQWLRVWHVKIEERNSQMQITSTNLLYIYVIIINVVTFFIYGLDKSKAKARQWRIPEAQLIFLAVIGGSVGALAGMKVFHHKTRKPKFKIGVPTILIIQLVIIYFLFSGNEEVYSVINEILQMFNL